MIEVKKVKNEMKCNNIVITNEETSLYLIFAGVLDLYWAIDSEDNKQMSIEITKENYEVYRVFETLYFEVMNGKVFSVDNFLDTKDLNEGMTETEQYKSLVSDNTITWYSDDDPLDEADMVSINYENESFIITFNNQSNRFRSFNSAVRFRISGSRYGYFYIPFMKMFNSMQEYDEKYHQIYMEEYLYQRKLEKKE